MQTALGLFAVFLFVGLATGIAAALHRGLRPARRDEGSISVALRNLEPKSGRQRFSVQLFEVALLGGAWSVGAVFIALWASLPQTKENDVATIGIVAVVVSLLSGTWWSWRRGALSDVVKKASNG